jgi:hypothetical protein
MSPSIHLPSEGRNKKIRNAKKPPGYLFPLMERE